MISMVLAATEPAADTNVWARVIEVLVPVALALIALFDKRVRSKVAGASSTTQTEPAPTAQTASQAASQAVTEGTGLQHLLVMDMQRRLDAAETRAEKLAADLDHAQEQVADLRVTVAQLEAQIARWRAGWDRP